MAGDNGGGSGGGGATIKQQLEQAQTRIAELEKVGEKVTKLETDFKASEEKAEKLGADLKSFEEKTTKLESDLKASEEKATKLEADFKASEEKATKLEADFKASEENLKNADSRADTRLREIVARSGGVLPPKDFGAGAKTDEQKPGDKAEAPAKRLASIFTLPGSTQA
ncbi:MAG: hypothetical protein V4710_06070 [Verrucomicrobiota bacterium]